jgi:hypothetical protein
MIVRKVYTMPTNQKNVVGLLMPDEMEAALRKQAHLENKGISAIMREALAEFLRARGHEVDPHMLPGPARQQR